MASHSCWVSSSPQILITLSFIPKSPGISQPRASNPTHSPFYFLFRKVTWPVPFYFIRTPLNIANRLWLIIKNVGTLFRYTATLFSAYYHYNINALCCWQRIFFWAGVITNNCRIQTRETTFDHKLVLGSRDLFLKNITMPSQQSLAQGRMDSVICL